MQEEASHGLMGAAKRLLSSSLSVISTRLELLGNELQEERLHLTQMVVMGLAVMFFLGMGILLLTVFFAVLFWDEHRLVALGSLSAFFFSLSVIVGLLLRNKSQRRPRLFSASLAELSRDRDRLHTQQRSAANHEE